jgi:hypothetical protein
MLTDGNERRLVSRRCLRAVLVIAGCWMAWPAIGTTRAGGVGTMPFELQGGERIVFFGDSITQAGG